MLRYLPLIFSLSLTAQITEIVRWRVRGVGTTAQRPSSCVSNKDMYVNTTTSSFQYCLGGVWTSMGSGGGVTTGVTLTADLPVIGAGSSAVAIGTRQGNTTKYTTYAGSAPSTNDCAKFDANGNITTTGAGCSAVSSVFSRTGAVAAQSGDYTAAQVTNAADITAANSYTAGAKQTWNASASTAGGKITCSALPSTPATGDVACDSGDANKLKWWDGSSWLTAGSSATGLGDPGSNSVVYRTSSTTSAPAKADQITGPLYCADAGGSDTYACSLSPAITSYENGTIYQFKANTANTGTATINLNSLGAKTIKKVAGGITTDLADNDIRSGQVVTLTYDGTNMQMQSTLGNAASGAGNVTTSATLTANLPVLGNGTTDVIVGTRSGNTTAYVTTTGAQTSGDCVKIDANGNHVANGSACGGGSGGWTLVEQYTASSSASLDFTSCISSTYDQYAILIRDLLPATDGAKIGMRVSTDGGSTYVSTSSYHWSTFVATTSASGTNGSTGDTALYFTNSQESTAGGYPLSATIYFNNPAGTTNYKTIHGTGGGQESNGSIISIWNFGAYKATTAVTDFQILASSGNLASGTVRCYGLAK